MIEVPLRISASVLSWVGCTNRELQHEWEKWFGVGSWGHVSAHTSSKQWDKSQWKGWSQYKSLPTFEATPIPCSWNSICGKPQVWFFKTEKLNAVYFSTFIAFRGFQASLLLKVICSSGHSWTSHFADLLVFWTMNATMCTLQLSRSVHCRLWRYGKCSLIWSSQQFPFMLFMYHDLIVTPSDFHADCWCVASRVAERMAGTLVLFDSGTTGEDHLRQLVHCRSLSHLMIWSLTGACHPAIPCSHFPNSMETPGCLWPGKDCHDIPANQANPGEFSTDVMIICYGVYMVTGFLPDRWIPQLTSRVTHPPTRAFCSISTVLGMCGQSFKPFCAVNQTAYPALSMLCMSWETSQWVTVACTLVIIWCNFSSEQFSFISLCHLTWSVHTQKHDLYCSLKVILRNSTMIPGNIRCILHKYGLYIMLAERW